MTELSVRIAGIELSIDVEERYFERLAASLRGYSASCANPLRISYEFDADVEGEDNLEPLVSLDQATSEWVIQQRGMVETRLNRNRGEARIRLSPSISSALTEDRFRQALKPLMALEVLSRGGVLLHSTGTVRDGKAYLFMGQSGAGKSTMASFFEEDAVLNDDLIALYPGPSGVVAHATPFTGTLEIRTSRREALVCRAFVLRQGPKCGVKTLNRTESFRALLQNASAPRGLAELDEQAFGIVAGFADCFDLNELTFVRDASETLAFLEESVWPIADSASRARVG